MDIISLGLDVASFNAQKIKTLKEFITIFDKLEKYDGKKFTPILGEGLTSFNNSIKETSSLLDELKVKMNSLSSSPVIISPSQTNNIKAVSTELEIASVKTKKLKENFDGSTASIASMGKELTKSLSLLRTIAYILPGIGIAGIFNLAGDAVISLYDAFSGVGRQMEIAGVENAKYIQDLKEIHDLLQDNLSLYQNGLDAAYKKDDLSYYQGLGENLGFILNKKKEIAELNKKDAISSLKTNLDNSFLGADGKQHKLDKSDLGGDLEKQAISIAQIGRELEILNKRKLELLKSGSFFTGDKEGDTTNNIDKLGKVIDATQKFYNQQFAILKNFNKAKADLDEANAQIEKYNSDQARKLLVENTKNEISVIIDKNKIILSDARSTKDELKSAQNEIERQQERLANINKINVIGTDKNPNITFRGTAEGKVAIQKELDENVKSREENRRKLEEIDIAFYQRLLKAKTDIKKNDIEVDAISNEKVFRNEEKSLSERLQAYINYIVGKQKIQQIEYERDIQKGASGPGGKRALTKEEELSLQSDKITLQTNIQADAQKQIYDIVFSSLQKQLKAVLDTNKLESQDNKSKWAAELNALTDLYDAKAIKYKRYKREIDRINKQYNIAKFDEDISDDEANISRLQALLRKTKSSLVPAGFDVRKAQVGVSFADQSGDKDQQLEAKRKYDIAVGNELAIKDAITKIDLELKAAQDTLEDDKLKRAKARLAQREAAEKESAANIKKIIEALFNLAKSVIDQEFANRIARLEDAQRATDEYYDNNIQAIEKSSLKEKDKTALEIQLTEQKKESDKSAALQERELKHKQAIIDKELGIARAVISTAVAVAEALKIEPPLGEIIAAERAILGGIEIATIAATPIPYAEGTPEGGHPGGLARYAEDGAEWVKKPYQSPYLVMTETVSYLPKGTEVIPFLDAPDFSGGQKIDNWEQTRWLAQQLRRNTPKVKNINNINIDLGHENYKRSILGN